MKEKISYLHIHVTPFPTVILIKVTHLTKKYINFVNCSPEPSREIVAPTQVQKFGVSRDSCSL